MGILRQLIGLAQDDISGGKPFAYCESNLFEVPVWGPVMQTLMPQNENRRSRGWDRSGWDRNYWRGWRWLSLVRRSGRRPLENDLR